VISEAAVRAMPPATYAFGGNRSNVGSVGGAPDINDAWQDHLINIKEARPAVRAEMTAAVRRGFVDLGIPLVIVTARPLARFTANGSIYRSTVAVMGGKFMVRVSAEVRKAAKVVGSDVVILARATIWR
jgi:hypothetical protein